MNATPETDSELEARARAQAAAIAEAQAAAQTSGVGQFFGAIGRALRLLPAPEPQPEASHKPERELLLWQMKQAGDLHEALELTFALLEDPRFLATVPSDRPCPVVTFTARRKWNEAAKEWSQMGGADAQTWLQCNRNLLVQRDGDKAQLLVSLKDLCVRFDARIDKLVPVRVEHTRPMTPENIDAIVQQFPNLTAAGLALGLRAPAKAFAKAPHSPADAYIAGGPLVASLEVFMQDKKKKKEEKEDPGKSFANWIASLVKGR